jgi:hypothetical protein
MTKKLRERLAELETARQKLNDKFSPQNVANLEVAALMVRLCIEAEERFPTGAA